MTAPARLPTGASAQRKMGHLINLGWRIVKSKRVGDQQVLELGRAKARLTVSEATYTKAINAAYESVFEKMAEDARDGA